jgi:hypothetical protein
MLVRSERDGDKDTHPGCENQKYKTSLRIFDMKARMPETRAEESLISIA